MNQGDGVYIVVDFSGFKVVGQQDGMQTTLAGPCWSLEEALKLAIQTRNGNPIAIKLSPC